MNRRSFLLGSVGAVACSAARVSEPAPYGATPSERQLRWSELEYYNFLHFTVNTFTDKEWGYGDESPSIFNPSSFDADAIVSDLKASGSKGVILTCKHHDGFCLWPTKTTERSVKSSPFRGGRGDVVREVSEAAARHGLKFGVYVSPWDRSEASYGTPAYIKTYQEQIRELLTGYGPVFEIWHDGANGGDGFYGGAREKRIIDKLHYYGWNETWQLERHLQPQAALFSDVGPDVRWVGNEKGVAGDPCWATYSPFAPDGGPGSPGNVREAEATSGTRGGKWWMPAECDVSIRPGWFWHAAENAKVKSDRELLQLYYTSVGRGASFLLNVPPDRRGLIADGDREQLRRFGQLISASFAHDFAKSANAMQASNSRGGENGGFGPRNLTDGRSGTYWATDDGATAAEVVLEFQQAITFNLVRLRETIKLGQRIDEFAVEVWLGNEWKPVARGTSVGMCRILRLASRVTTIKVRLRVIKAAAPLAVSELGLFAEA